MGDLIGSSVSGKLEYIDYPSFEELLNCQITIQEKSEIISIFCRINCLYMIAKAGSGHIGSSFSSLDLMSYLLLSNLESIKSYNIDSPFLFFSSKGHDAPALYSLYTGLGIIEFNKIHYLRKKNGLPGHPDVGTDGIFVNTGSLGMGISKAKGLISANRLLGIHQKVFVLTGDGELQEGQFWESLLSASNHEMDELVVIIDHNKLQSDTFLEYVSDLGDLSAKLNSFGWNVLRCDGNNFKEIHETFSKAIAPGRPTIIIADTVKGKGVSFMEHTSFDSDNELYKFHSGAPDKSSYDQALNELKQRLYSKIQSLKLTLPKLVSVESPEVPYDKEAVSLISYYSNFLTKLGSNNKLVVLDADLVKDTGCLDFKQKFPERFIECGIAEQDMVSQAGAISAKGLLPIVHSFSCFLSSRPNEQIYNNATQKNKIIYVGSLAGILPGGPGHSHQAVRDIASLSSIPGLTIAEPSCQKELELICEWAIHNNSDSTYIRLVSIPYKQRYHYSQDKISPGKGITLIDGTDIVIMTYGPLFTNLVYELACSSDFKNKIHLINMPWLNVINEVWLKEMLGNHKKLLIIDNHYSYGGLGTNIFNKLSANNIKIESKILGINEIPICGTNDEVLNYHSLDYDSIADTIRTMIDS